MNEQVSPCSVDAAIAEVQRELQVRVRLYPRWVAEGKQLTAFESKERMQRLEGALHFLGMFATGRTQHEPILLDPPLNAASA